MTDSLASWLERLERRHPKEIDLGLERCSRVFERMGSLAPAPRVFTVAGTNGKGSVVAYLDAMLTALGFRSATYTSPHLHIFNERVRIEGLDASNDQLVTAFEKTELARGDVSLTYFEFTTLAAFSLLNECGLDTAVLEVGLGGRLDTVNLADPDCVVITPIGLDHQDYLGKDRESIGFEKAGVMRQGIPVICGDRQPPDSIIARAKQLEAGLMVLGQDFDYEMAEPGIRLELDEKYFELALPGMQGRHQLDNLVTAVAALHSLYSSKMEQSNSWKESIPDICIPGRLAGHQSDPRFVLDVGHNPMAAEVVARHLAERVTGRIFCVLGMLRDKDAPEVSRILGETVDTWLCAGLTGSRGQSGYELAEKVSTSVQGNNVAGFATVKDAINKARETATNDDLVLVFGSFETVAKASRILSLQPGPL